jgi:hypothetical protein
MTLKARVGVIGILLLFLISFALPSLAMSAREAPKSAQKPLVSKTDNGPGGRFSKSTAGTVEAQEAQKPVIDSIVPYSPKENNEKRLKIGISKELRNASKAVLRLTYKNKTIGTAFHYGVKVNGSPYFFLLTAAHTVEGLGNVAWDIFLESEDLPPTPLLRIVKLNAEDTAMLVVSSNPSIRALPYLEAAPLSQLSLYGKIFSINYSVFQPDLSNTKLFSVGRIQSTTAMQGLLTISLDLMSKGGSGAPVLLERDSRVVGMVSRQVYDASEKRYIGVFHAVLMQEIDIALLGYIDDTHNGDKLRK